MKNLIPIGILLFFCCTAKAQKNDTTIYYGCHIKNDTNTYVGSQITRSAPDCNFFSWPKFPGSGKAWSKFLRKHLKWPNSMLDGQGKVFIDFVIEKNGLLSNINILRAATPEFAAEALRVIKLSPKWIPAKIDGKPVRCKYTVPISFILSS